MKLYLNVLLFLSFKVIACDMCGNYMGITPYDNQNQITCLHRYRVFNGYRNYQQSSSFFIPGAYRTMHGPGAGGDSVTEVKNHSSKDYETFKVIELRGKYFFHPRWEVNCIVPVQQIKTKYDEVKNTTTGIADPSVFVGYHLIKRLNDVVVRQRLIIGGGLKFPMGNYQKEDAEHRRIFLLTQNGTGSLDKFVYLNYIVSRKWIGINVNGLFKMNGENKFHERIANSYNQVISVFAKVELKNMRLFPSVLANYEYNKGVYVNGQLTPNTNMNLLMVGPALDLNYKSFVLNMSYQFNAYERVSSQTLSTAGRFTVGLTFNFSGQNYLVRKKN